MPPRISPIGRHEDVFEASADSVQVEAPLSLRAKRSNPESRDVTLDCFVAALLA